MADRRHALCTIVHRAVKTTSLSQVVADMSMNQHVDSNMMNFGFYCAMHYSAKRSLAIACHLLRHVRREWALLLFQDVCLSVCMYVASRLAESEP